MKHLTLILSLSALITLPAAVPVRWTVETSRVQPAVFEAYQGETLDLAASLQSHGKPVEMPGPASLYWQTNGMGARWWTAPASVSSNILSAVWSPTNDVGARVYTCFIGQSGSNYRAEFQLRLRPSPGATPNVLPIPHLTEVDIAGMIDDALEERPAGVSADQVRDMIDSEVGGTNSLTHGGPYVYAERGYDADDGSVRKIAYLGMNHGVTLGGSHNDYFLAYRPSTRTQHWGLGILNTTTGLSPFPYDSFHPFATEGDVKTLMEYFEDLDEAALRRGETSASDVGAAPASVADDISDAKMWAMGVYQYMLGQTNAWAAFTNYPPDRATYESKFHYVPEPGVDYSDVPSSMQLYEVRGGETNIVYDSRSWPAWYYRYKERQMLDRLEQITNRIPAKGWAKYHAYSGTEVPSPDMTIIDTPYLVLQGGYEWEKTVTTHGTIFTIISNGLSADFNSMENATNGSLFAIRDLEGNDVFSIRNEQSVLASSVPKSVVMSTDSSGHTVASVRFVCDYEPVPGAALDIIPVGNGKMFLFKNDDPDCPAHITVSGSVPNWTVTAVSKGIGYPYTRMFIGAVYEQPGNKVVKSGYPFDISGGFMYNGVKILPITNSDHTVTWRWE